MEAERTTKRIMTPGRWILGNDTGVSSRTIWAVMTGEVTAEMAEAGSLSDCFFDVPHDPADFGRCHRLLVKFPEWRQRIREMGGVFAKWGPMAEKWSEMEKLYIEEAPTGRCPKLSALIKELETEGMLEAGWQKNDHGCWRKAVKNQVAA